MQDVTGTAKGRFFLNKGKPAQKNPYSFSLQSLLMSTPMPATSHQDHDTPVLGSDFRPFPGGTLISYSAL
jgi:hypothetical protein